MYLHYFMKTTTCVHKATQRIVTILAHLNNQTFFNLNKLHVCFATVLKANGKKICRNPFHIRQPDVMQLTVTPLLHPSIKCGHLCNKLLVVTSHCKTLVLSDYTHSAICNGKVQLCIQPNSLVAVVGVSVMWKGLQ